MVTWMNRPLGVTAKLPDLASHRLPPPAQWNVLAQHQATPGIALAVTCVTIINTHVIFFNKCSFKLFSRSKSSLPAILLLNPLFSSSYCTVKFTSTLLVSLYLIFHTYLTIVWPCIVADPLWIKPTDALNSNFIGITTLHFLGADFLPIIRSSYPYIDFGTLYAVVTVCY